MITRIWTDPEIIGRIYLQACRLQFETFPSETEKNEILYGLKGLEQAIEFERELGNLQEDVRITCLLSVSVTHCNLHGIAKDYLGYVLIIFGVLILLWVLLNVYNLFTNPDKLLPFQELVSGHLETTISHAEKEGLKIVIPKEK